MLKIITKSIKRQEFVKFITFLENKKSFIYLNNLRLNFSTKTDKSEKNSNIKEIIANSAKNNNLKYSINAIKLISFTLNKNLISKNIFNEENYLLLFRKIEDNLENLIQNGIYFVNLI